MVTLTRLDNTMLVVNSDLIECIEFIPETIVCLTTGKKIMVKETVEQIIEQVAAFKRRASNTMIVQENKGTTDDAGNIG